VSNLIANQHQSINRTTILVSITILRQIYKLCVKLNCKSTPRDIKPSRSQQYFHLPHRSGRRHWNADRWYKRIHNDRKVNKHERTYIQNVSTNTLAWSIWVIRIEVKMNI